MVDQWLQRLVQLRLSLVGGEEERWGKGTQVVALYNISVGIMHLFLALHNSGTIVWIIQVVKLQVIQSFAPSLTSNFNVELLFCFPSLF